MKEKHQNNNPKILMIAPLPPPIHGSSMMTQYIKDSSTINQNFNLDWINLSTSRSMAEIGRMSIKKIFRFASSFLKTIYKLSTNKYKFCYIAITCHGKPFLKDTPFALICKLFGYKLVLHQHNKGMANDVSKSLYRFLFKRVYKDSTVILLSERLYPDISNIVSHKQVMICPNGIPIMHKYPKKNNDVPQLLFLSNLIESKGVIILLDACKKLKDTGNEFTCVVVGSETKEIDQYRFEEEIKKREIEDIIHYLGPKFGEAKNRIISESDIFVFPTSYSDETFGLVLLEAMQQAVPQISTSVGGIPDIIINGYTGLIFEEGNSEDLAIKIKYLLDNPTLRKHMGDNSRIRFKKLYTLRNFEKSIIEIFSEIE